jgi:hypothetical protein
MPGGAPSADTREVFEQANDGWYYDDYDPVTDQNGADLKNPRSPLLLIVNSEASGFRAL